MMDKYVFLIFLLAPGFIACSTAYMLHDFPDKHGELSLVMRYFTYSFFILPMVLVAGGLLGIIPADISGAKWTTWQAVALFILAAVLSAGTGAVWVMWMRDKVLGAANRFNMSQGRNPVFVQARLFDRLFDDGRDHFLVIEKDGQIISMGMFAGAGAPDNSKMEIALYDYPEYRRWFEYARESKEDHPLKHTLTVYYCIEDGLTIREYEFPPEWTA